MRPSLSILLLTTLIGAGQGLFVAVAGTEALSMLRAMPLAPIEPLLVWGSAVSLVFCAAGLAASFAHLGHPERAWRAAASWRTSWLSREVVVLPAFMLAVFAYGLAHGLAAGPQVALGAIGIALALALYICTGMVYVAIKVLREWATPLTVVNFTLMGLASGFTLAAALAAAVAPDRVADYAAIAALLAVVAAASRLGAQARNAKIAAAATVQSAIGVMHPRIVQHSQGAMGGSFNTREFFHGRSPEFAANMARAFPLVAFAVPAILLAIGAIASAGVAVGAVLLAVPVQLAGLLIERWVFFAQARHPQNLYYQSVG